MDTANRDQAPFDPALWPAIEEAAIAAMRAMLTARRVLDVDGPYGLGLTVLELGDDRSLRTGPGEAEVSVGRALPVPLLRQPFSLSLRRLAAAAERGQPLDLKAAEDAAEALALAEESLIYQGRAAIGVPGLLSDPSVQVLTAGDWRDLDRVLADVVGAVTRIDEAGHRGPYALVLAPRLYNGLFRRYAQSDLLQVEHLSRLCTGGVFKTNVAGGAVIDPRAGRIVVGQDLRAGFARHDGVHAELYLTESLVLKLEDPTAVCRLEMPEIVST